jgi:hypothetical protein
MIECTSPLAGFELTTLVMLGTYCTGSCKSNNQKITTTTAPMTGATCTLLYSYKKGDFLIEMAAWASLTVIESRHKFVLVSRSRGR